MIVRQVAEAEATTTSSRQVVHPEDGVGFSMQEVRFPAGTRCELRYGGRSDALFVTEGRGEMLDKRTGERTELRRGVLCALAEGDELEVVAVSDMRAVCATMPPAGDR